MGTPVGFAVAAPRNLRRGKEGRLLSGGELDALLDKQITALQGNAVDGPNGI
ncbi:MAG TPA: hypothetical protein VJI52_04375 [Candidatus Nanoarchaeia archaeon]|nr:hypothetical protein [Candidatus Nanoarchaeia archaeon]